MGRIQKHEVCLTKEERKTLSDYISAGNISVREAKRIQVLLSSDRNGPSLDDREISELLGMTITQIYRLRIKFNEERLNVIKHKKGAGRPRIIDGDHEAHMIAIACSTPPKDRARWSLKMIADRVVSLTELDSISHQTVKNILKKTNLNLVKKSS